MSSAIDDASPHPALQQLKIRLQNIHDAISTYQPLTAKPPILDSSLNTGTDTSDDGQWLQQEHIQGLKKLRDSVKVDLDVLEKFLSTPGSAHLPPLSTNAPYLIAVWNEVLCAPPPVDAVFKSMPLTGPSADQRQRGAQRPPAVKVDVVADNGKRWIRVNTVKNARMLAEFREIDSYLTDSDDSDYEKLEDARPTLAQAEFDNSILRMGRSLLAAAKANLIDGTSEIPRITLRLTRLDPSPPLGSEEENDPRILQTLQLLRGMGIDVELGERRGSDFPAPANEPSPASSSSPSTSSILLEPTININLDLSVLIALISDLTHSPLPKTVEEANTRFIPPQHYREWKQKKNGMYGKKRVRSKEIPPSESPIPSRGETDVRDIPSELAKHSRALTNQLLQEMVKGLLQEIHERISVIDARSTAKVKFWTTLEARDRCLRIISKIGGASEKRRAHALFHAVSTLSPEVLSAEDAEDLFWRDSRYAPKFIALFPINLYPASSAPGVALVPEASGNRSQPPFFRALAKTCEDILAQETIPNPRPRFGAVVTNDESLDDTEEIQGAIVTKANPRLTAHTVQSLLWGAELGWTTLTANKTSIRAILREMKLARISGRLDCLSDEDAKDEVPGIEGNLTAAIWVVDPRSLAEGMSNQSRASV
ncbi:hypothetical protein Hypma_009502 [Hypsizygus marmoreus]|uniref:DUF1308 domain-containing protein n=1 Tax=Hypsizygus marmoreus TaxID=39966 RepID=A0A369JW58_HYPMA|nr:hypothetical protein Hypma_009502 [Hypsizygus marmoreus]